MGMIYNQAVVMRFVERKNFLQGAQARSQDPVILKNAQSVVQHLHPAPLAGLQFLIGGESVQRCADSQPRNQKSSQRYYQSRSAQRFFFSPARDNQNGQK